VGTAGFGGVWGEVNDADSIAALHDAWDHGFLFCDSAPSYSRAELVLGAALKTWSGPRPIVATKFGYTSPTDRDYSPAGLDRLFRQSIERLGGFRPDAMAIHDAQNDVPEATREAAIGYIRGLLQAGEVRHAGLGGGGPAVQREWLASGVFRYILTYNRLNACVLDALRDGVPQAHAHRAKAFAASPLFMGLLGRRFDEFRANPVGFAEPEFVARATAIHRLSNQAGLPMPEVALRFLLSMAEIDALVVGASSLAEWRQTRAAFEAGPLPADLFNAIIQIASPAFLRQSDGG